MWSKKKKNGKNFEFSSQVLIDIWNYKHPVCVNDEDVAGFLMKKTI